MFSCIARRPKTLTMAPSRSRTARCALLFFLRKNRGFGDQGEWAQVCLGRKFACLQSLAFPFNLTCLAAKAKWRGESAGKGWCSTSVSVLGTTYRNSHPCTSHQQWSLSHIDGDCDIGSPFWSLRHALLYLATYIRDIYLSLEPL